MVTFFGKLSCKFHTSVNFRGGIRQSSELLYGIHPVLCALTFRHRDIYRLYVKDVLSNCKDPDNLVEISASQITEKALKYGIPVTRVPVEKLKELSNSRAHQGVILEVSPTTIQSISDSSIKNLLFSWNNLSGCLPYTKKYHRPTVLLLDHMMDIMNFGNILRSAAFFGISAVILSTSPCVSPSPLISKISVGAMESILFYRLTDTVMDMKSLSNAGFLIVGTCGESQLPSTKASKSTNFLKPDEVGANDDNNTGVYPRPLVLALGSESRGLSENILNACDLLLRIPGFGDSTKLNQCLSQSITSSLNVSVAAAYKEIMKSEQTGEVLLPPSAFLISNPSHFNCPQDVINDAERINSAISNKSTRKLSISSIISKLNKNSADLNDDGHFDLINSEDIQFNYTNKFVDELKQENEYLLRSQTKALDELNKIRGYIGLGRVSSKITFKEDSLEQHKCICDTELLEKLKYLENKNSELNLQLEQMNSRMSSLETVLEIQEKQLSRESGNEVLPVNNKSGKVENLLCTWRKHVLRLLIEIENLKSENSHTVTKSKCAYEKLLSEFESLKATLEATEFKLKASDSALNVERNKRQGFEKDLESLHSKLAMTQSNLIESRENYKKFALNTKQNLDQIVKAIQTFMNWPESGPLSQQTPITICSVFRRLRHLERRLEFANSRLPVLRTRLLLSSSLLHRKADVDQSTQVSYELKHWIGDILSESEKEEIISQAQTEALRAIKERDRALEQLSDYVKSFDNRVQDAEKAECSDQLKSEKLTNNDLEQKYTDEIGHLKTQLSETDMKLTKALTELRRAERRVDREINERKLQINSIENTYKSKIQTLENALHSFYPEPYHCYGNNTAKSPNVIQKMTSPIVPTFASHIDLNESIRKLDHLADRLNSDLSSDSDAEKDVEQ
ncbi:uncharacterized protein DC041_0008251 [Schistosoma bovis]|uniref:rRNA methyltransferase 1, mitochondrial n=1 Tax=Schistosoma bovis TaxID=6184 RepID=A0A430QNX0_SCHBO|nr:uncharacterized protein DC041_0008251 [Schistosoma bovis]